MLVILEITYLNRDSQDSEINRMKKS